MTPLAFTREYPEGFQFVFRLESLTDIENPTLSSGTESHPKSFVS